MIIYPVHPFQYIYQDSAGNEISLPLQGMRDDQGGGEGFPADTQEGGRWTRTYRVLKAAFPHRHPNTDGRIVDGLDNQFLYIESVQALQLAPYPEILEITCYFVGSEE